MLSKIKEKLAPIKLETVFTITMLWVGLCTTAMFINWHNFTKTHVFVKPSAIAEPTILPQGYRQTLPMGGELDPDLVDQIIREALGQ